MSHKKVKFTVLTINVICGIMLAAHLLVNPSAFHSFTHGSNTIKMQSLDHLALQYQSINVTKSSPETINNNPGLQEEALPRILCWVLCDPNDLDKRVKHVKATWTRHCDITLFMSSATNDTFPTIGLNVSAGRQHISAKSRAAWTYVHDRHINDADYFVKTDPDTFLIVYNLKKYLASRNPDTPEFFGHRFHLKYINIYYNSGSPGQVLSRGAVRALVASDKKCMPDGPGEDWKTAQCLKHAGIYPTDTRDWQGRETFLVFPPSISIRGEYPLSYYNYDVDGPIKGQNCCSIFPIGMHYVNNDDQYNFYYFFYTMKEKQNITADAANLFRFRNNRS